MTALTIGNFVPACLALSDERNPRGFVGGRNERADYWAVDMCLEFWDYLFFGTRAGRTWTTVQREGEVSVWYAWGRGARCGAGWMIAIIVGMITVAEG